ncbi:hypothetical protein R1sor_014741 [Riccia sorocarpa]|uniref:Uncharacterized protein n=1 Tax=Riccia sorocarpa TaxID=122646 RepID=A0ABD3HCV5_9MARC
MSTRTGDFSAQNGGRNNADKRELLKILKDTQGVHNYYASLFKEEELTPQARLKLEEVLSLVKKKVSAAQNITLCQQPQGEESKETVENLKKDKAPGLDGLTAESLWALGEI